MEEASGGWSWASCDPGARASKRHRPNLLHSLFVREIRGSLSLHSKSKRLNFFTHIPSRLIFCLSDIVPPSALEGGHVFMGFTQCGQFLLSYTLSTEPDHMNITYRYRLHWWLFVPYQKTRKVAEVTLFNDQGVYYNLYITMCQWPRDASRVLIYGYSGEGLEFPSSQPAHCHLTITAAPSLHNCKDCQMVAASYEDEDLAAGWDSCMRFSCLRHGLTLHTAFDVVPPYPRFEPHVSMGHGGGVVINTGNFLHVLRVRSEYVGGGGGGGSRKREGVKRVDGASGIVEEATGGKCPLPPSVSIDASLFPDRSKACEMSDFLNNQSSLLSLGSSSSETLLFPAPPPASYSVFSTESESEDSIPFPDPNNSSSSTSYSFFRPAPTPIEQPSSWRRRLADKAYEFTEENPESAPCCEKLSTFRKRRLADKKYEFSDEDAENIVPFRRQMSLPEPPPLPPLSPRSGGSAATPPPVPLTPLQLAMSPPSSHGWDNFQVLRPRNCNSSSPNPGVLLVSPSPRESELVKGAGGEWEAGGGRGGSKEGAPAPLSAQPPLQHASGGGMRKDHAESSVHPQLWTQGTRCVVEFLRRYVEVDDELMTVITDIEDDDLSGNSGFHTALPLEVHGSGYAQMQMISNGKAEKLMAPCVLVQQKTFDFEQFCHDMAQKLCADAGTKYWFCNDYDMEIVDVCPDSGLITVVAVILVQATVKTKGLAKSQRYPVNSKQRRLYQTGFKFVWSMDTGCYMVIDTDPLQEMAPCSVAIGSGGSGSNGNGNNALGEWEEWRETWHPARDLCLKLRDDWFNLDKGPHALRVFSNDSVHRGRSLDYLEDAENFVGLVLDTEAI